jgi:hypothetical protein
VRPKLFGLVLTLAASLTLLGGPFTRPSPPSLSTTITGDRHRAPVALERLSLAGLGLGVLAVAHEGVHWQLVPWLLLVLACAAVALLRRQRVARSRRVVRVVGRAALVLGVLAGGVGLLAARVPQLPRPSSPHLVGKRRFPLDRLAAARDLRHQRGGAALGRRPSVDVLSHQRPVR